MTDIKRYKVIAGPLEHDGDRYEDGDLVPVANVEQAQALIGCGVLAPAEEQEKPKTNRRAAKRGG